MIRLVNKVLVNKVNVFNSAKTFLITQDLIYVQPSIYLIYIYIYPLPAQYWDWAS